jgi:hypothetical protein
MASIVISPENNMLELVSLAGGSMEQTVYSVDTLYVSDVSQEDLDAALALYSGDLETYFLTPLRTAVKNRPTRDANFYISQSYPSYNREFLSALWEEARADGMVNRVNYIRQLMTWVSSVVSYTITQEDALDLETDPDIIRSFSIDFSIFDATNPNITIKAALEILD